MPRPLRVGIPPPPPLDEIPMVAVAPLTVPVTVVFAPATKFRFVTPEIKVTPFVWIIETALVTRAFCWALVVPDQSDMVEPFRVMDLALRLLTAMDWFQVGFLVIVVVIGLGGFAWAVFKKD